MKKLALVAATVLLAGCSGAQPGTGTTLSPNPPAPAEASSAPTPGNTPAPTPSGPAKNARGNTLKEIGERAALVSEDGKTLVEFKVTSIEPNFKCNAEYAEKSKNGLFVAVGLEIMTAPEP